MYVYVYVYPYAHVYAYVYAYVYVLGFTLEGLGFRVHTELLTLGLGFGIWVLGNDLDFTVHTALLALVYIHIYIYNTCNII